MFSNLARNSQVYILLKGADPEIKIGVVDTILTPQFPTYQTFLPQQMDIIVKVGNESMRFEKLPSNMSSYDYGNAIIADSQEGMDKEVDIMMRHSLHEISEENISMHRSIAEKCKELKKELSPSYRKEQEQEERINSMEARILKGVEEMIAKAMNK